MTTQTNNMRVEIYFNLHKKCLSIRHKGLVIAHAAAAELTDIKFAVSQAGRARVLREKRKNVHAYVRGTLASYIPLGESVPYDNEVVSTVTYNPYKYDSFVRVVDQSRITKALSALVVGRRILAVE